MKTFIRAIVLLITGLAHICSKPYEQSIISRESDVCIVYLLIICVFWGVYLMLAMATEEYAGDKTCIRVMLPLLNIFALTILLRLTEYFANKLNSDTEVLLSEKKSLLFFYTSFIFIIVLSLLCITLKDLIYVKYICLIISIVVGYCVSLGSILQNNSVKDFIADIWKELNLQMIDSSTGLSFVVIFVIVIATVLLELERYVQENRICHVTSKKNSNRYMG